MVYTELYPNNEKFFKLAEFVEKHQVDQDIHRILKAFYAYDPALLKQWPLREYKAFNLIKYRNSLPGNKQGRFAVFSNRKGHKFYLEDLQYINNQVYKSINKLKKKPDDFTVGSRVVQLMTCCMHNL